MRSLHLDDEIRRDGTLEWVVTEIGIIFISGDAVVVINSGKDAEILVIQGIRLGNVGDSLILPIVRQSPVNIVSIGVSNITPSEVHPLHGSPGGGESGLKPEYLVGGLGIAVLRIEGVIALQGAGEQQECREQ
jgi:hypothetical protein